MASKTSGKGAKPAPKKTPARSTPKSGKPAPKSAQKSGGKPARQAKPGPGFSPFRADILGVVLVLLAILTLLSLVTTSRGDVTEGWIGLLRSLVGQGVWGIPLVAGALGLWLIIRAIERMPNMSWQRPAGFGVLFLAFITAASLWLPAVNRADLALAGQGGGVVGATFADLFQGLLGAWGAWAIVTFLVILGLALLADRLLLDAWYILADWNLHRALRQADPRAPTPTLNPPVPLPRGAIPWWKRWFPQAEHQPGQPTAQPILPPVLPPPSPAPNLVRAEPGAPVEPPRAPAPAAPTAAPPAPTRGLTQPATDADLLSPRIVGSSPDWKLPALGVILNDWERVSDSDEYIRQQGRLIQETLALFGVPADFEGAYKGPSVTQYLIKPGYVDRKVGAEQQRIKVKVAKIAALSNDLALALAAASVRIEAPIPGTNYVGVEVPNQASNVVGLKELMESETFVDMKGRLRIALGEDVKGMPVVADLARMPHLLIAGATGSGKSVCINSIIACLLLTHTPESLRLLMVDPKMVELSVYNGIPHLLSPVVTEVDKASAILFWAVKEMERRYGLFNKANARDLARYNAHLQKNGEKPLPTIVVIVDEMADLMMAAPEEVEKHICRLAQMARAVGIHLIIATQRPSVDVITGLIKANFPARIAFAVTSQIDSRVILDIPGAERLLGRGDMLFMAPDASKLERIQGTYLNDDEINKLVRYWKGIRTYAGSPFPGDPGDPGDPGETGRPAAPGDAFDPTGAGSPTTGYLNADPTPSRSGAPASAPAGLPPGPLSQAPLFEQIEQLKAAEARDDLYDQAVLIVQEQGRGSINLLQRKLRIGYGRAARLYDQLVQAGIITHDPPTPTTPAPTTPAASRPTPPDPTAPPTPFTPPPPPAGQPRIIGADPTATPGAAPGAAPGDDPAASSPSTRVWM